MALDALLGQLEHTSTQRFVKREDIYSQLATQSLGLLSYSGKPLHLQELKRLDALALAFKRKQTEELSDVIDRIDEVRAPYRVQGPTAMYEIISQSPAQYKTRFAEIEEVLQTQEPTFDDVALTKDWLETNSYLKRKRKTNQEFDQQATALENKLEARLATYQGPMKPKLAPRLDLDPEHPGFTLPVEPKHPGYTLPVEPSQPPGVYDELYAILEKEQRLTRKFVAVSLVASAAALALAFTPFQYFPIFQ